MVALCSTTGPFDRSNQTFSENDLCIRSSQCRFEIANALAILNATEFPNSQRVANRTAPPNYEHVRNLKFESSGARYLCEAKQKVQRVAHIRVDPGVKYLPARKLERSVVSADERRVI